VAEHEIEITLPRKALMNVDAKILIKSDGRKLGELHVSKGTVDWKAKGKKQAKYFSWERFAEVLDEAQP
jgi:hypothetical protein